LFRLHYLRPSPTAALIKVKTPRPRSARRRVPRAIEKSCSINNLSPALLLTGQKSEGRAVSGKEHAPLCPACGTRMKLARVTGRPYGRYRLATFECAACRLSYTEAQSDGDDAEPPARE
jgi:hypothetical protein